MKPFDTPANTNLPLADMPAAGLADWLAWPLATWAASYTVAAETLRLTTAMQRAALEVLLNAHAAPDVGSPAAMAAAAELRETGAAVLGAQMEALERLRGAR
ncbi:MAG: hypothetical protein NW200_06995 [Hyphomonadaceae bacterium]|nr:hypothetical protein [Hyphomonadaceae bacterium]